MEASTVYNYSLILKNLVRYIPARILTILNSFLIIPLLTFILDVKEVSIYLIAIQILNILCTCSFDGIGKIVLRYYERYSIQDKLSTFFSTIFYMMIASYSIILVLFFFFKNLLIEYFSLGSFAALLTILLVLPCGIRQVLYQILRAKNLYWLYTLSIVIYQLMFIVLFLAFVKFIPNASSILFAMICAIVIIDIYLLKSVGIKFSLKFDFDTEILQDSLKYVIPLIFTNLIYCLLFSTPKLLFQFNNQFLYTSIFGVAWSISNSIQPLASLFIFVNFPTIIKLHENNESITSYVTSMLQLYLFMLLPLLCVFYFFSNDIVNILLPEQYLPVAQLLPIFASLLFIHEMMKLINIKYHIDNKTYIETCVIILAVLIFSFVLIKFFNTFSLLSIAILMLLCEIFIFSLNNIIKIKKFVYISYSKIFKTLLFLLAIIFAVFLILNFVFQGTNATFSIVKCVLYFLFTYGLSYHFRKYIFV